MTNGVEQKLYYVFSTDEEVAELQKHIDGEAKILGLAYSPSTDSFLCEGSVFNELSNRLNLEAKGLYHDPLVRWLDLYLEDNDEELEISFGSGRREKFSVALWGWSEAACIAFPLDDDMNSEDWYKNAFQAVKETVLVYTKNNICSSIDNLLNENKK